ncbi:MAG: hypothetical protein H7X95_09755 [Deltaproteobacteria bacterium]|nr:hypothetical protein [Deltaproteobacteria bacterium]
MYTLDRTHRLRADLDWMPRELKALRWSVTGACWVGATGLAVAATIGSGGALAHVAAVAAAGGLYGGARAGRAMMLRHLGQLAHGLKDLDKIDRQAEGRLIHVSGRVSAVETLPTFLHGVPSVYRRMTFRLGHSHYVHEGAVDFDLVDDAGSRLHIHVDDARLFVPPARALADYPASLFTSRPQPPSLAAVVSAHVARAGATAAAASIASGEVMLPVDARVDVIGYKTESIDPVAGTSVGRGPPLRVALRSGRIPVIISPHAPLEPPDGL